MLDHRSASDEKIAVLRRRAWRNRRFNGRRDPGKRLRTKASAGASLLCSAGCLLDSVLVSVLG